MRFARATFLALLAVGVAALEASPAAAAGGVYNVVKCHPWHLEADEIEQAGGHPSYLTVNDCRGNASDRKIGIYNNGGAGNNAYSQYMYTAPFGTHIETVCLDYNLRRDSHHQAEILAYPGFQVLASGGDGPAGWTNGCFDLNHSQLIVRLACSHAGRLRRGPQRPRLRPQHRHRPRRRRRPGDHRVRRRHDRLRMAPRLEDPDRRRGGLGKRASTSSWGM